MLPRLALLALVLFAAGGHAQPTATQQPTSGGLINRLLLAAQRSVSATSSGDGSGPCKGTRCARVDGLQVVPPPEQARSAPVAPAAPETVEEDDYEEDDDDDDDGAAVEEGRGKKKKKKGMGKYIVMAGFTKAVLLYFMIHAVAMLAGKALVIAKVALAIATALALKKSHDHKTSYEIVKHPQYSSVHTHSQSVDYDHGGGYEGGSRRRRTARR